MDQFLDWQGLVWGCAMSKVFGYLLMGPSYKHWQALSLKQKKWSFSILACLLVTLGILGIFVGGNAAPAQTTTVQSAATTAAAPMTKCVANRRNAAASLATSYKLNSYFSKSSMEVADEIFVIKDITTDKSGENHSFCSGNIKMNVDRFDEMSKAAAEPRKDASGNKNFSPEQEAIRKIGSISQTLGLGLIVGAYRANPNGFSYRYKVWTTDEGRTLAGHIGDPASNYLCSVGQC